MSNDAEEMIAVFVVLGILFLPLIVGISAIGEISGEEEVKITITGKEPRTININGDKEYNIYTEEYGKFWGIKKETYDKLEIDNSYYVKITNLGIQNKGNDIKILRNN